MKIGIEMNYPEGWGLKEFFIEKRLSDHDEAVVYFIEHTEPQEDICKHFGCGRKLYPQEKLFSDYCFFHKKTLPNFDGE